MRLTQHTDYALRLLVHLAVAPEGRVTAVDVANTFGISVDHLRKVVQLLAGAGYVNTRRGRTGGVALAKPPADICIGDVVRLTETDFGLVECFRPDNRCVLTPGCAIIPVLADARDAFLAVLDRATLADCIGDSAGIRRLLSLGTD